MATLPSRHHAYGACPPYLVFSFYRCHVITTRTNDCTQGAFTCTVLSAWMQEKTSLESCLQAEPLTFTESEADYGKYLGPGSRCLMQSPGFARNGFSNSDRRPTAGCYHTLCKGEEGHRHLYVHFEGPDVDVACPSGEYVDLDSVEGVCQVATPVSQPCSGV